MQRYVVFLAVFVGCGSSDQEAVGSGHGQCTRRSGTYINSYVERQGTCGPVPEKLFSIVDQPPSGPPLAPCVGPGIRYSSDNCEVTYENTCPEDGIEKGGVLRISGLSKWNVSGTYGTAVEQWLLTSPNGNTRCQGTYDVTIRRQ